MTRPQIEEALSSLESLSKQGESYADASRGRFGWRNPIRSDTGGILRALVVANAPGRILEIGTAHGLSALHMVSGFSSFEGVRLDTIEFDSEVAEQTQRRMDLLGVPVRVLIGEALSVIAGLTDAYGMVFFDAQKDQYLPQLESLIERGLLAPGAVIVADNVHDRREECRAFLDWFVEKGVNHHIVPTECGLLVAKF